MRVKYNRVSTVNQTFDRFSVDDEKYDLVLNETISGRIKFKERPYGKKVVELVESGQLKELVFEEMSRSGRNSGDIVNLLNWLEEYQVNVVIRNLGVQSRPNGKPNPIWKLFSTLMSGIYEMELENIKERTHNGIRMYVQNGGKLGRPKHSNESNLDFLKKDKSVKILKLLERGLRYSEIQEIVKCSPNLIQKVKRIANPEIC